MLNLSLQPATLRQIDTIFLKAMLTPLGGRNRLILRFSASQFLRSVSFNLTPERRCRFTQMSKIQFLRATTDHEPCGEEIAGHLSRHLSRFGPPLFLKRDNAGNLNHTSVNDLLEEMMVIPINSPCYTASCNGAIKHSQGELKTWMIKWKTAAKTTQELGLLVDNAAHTLNHRSRRSLSVKNACALIFLLTGYEPINVNERRLMTGSGTWPLTYRQGRARIKDPPPKGVVLE